MKIKIGKKCEECNGTGQYLIECESCGGGGFYMVHYGDRHPHEVDCEDCLGLGEISDGDCEVCEGLGVSSNLNDYTSKRMVEILDHRGEYDPETLVLKEKGRIHEPSRDKIEDD